MSLRRPEAKGKQAAHCGSHEHQMQKLRLHLLGMGRVSGRTLSVPTDRNPTETGPDQKRVDWLLSRAIQRWLRLHHPGSWSGHPGRFPSLCPSGFSSFLLTLQPLPLSPLLPFWVQRVPLNLTPPATKTQRSLMAFTRKALIGLGWVTAHS